MASTKVFTSQISIIALISIYIGRLLGSLSFEDAFYNLKELNSLLDKVQKILSGSNSIQNLAEQFYKANNALFFGRGLHYTVALEGASKLKEISYINAEGYPAAEMKQGPIALIDKNMPVFVIATKDFLYDKTINNIKEVKIRKRIVIAIASENNSEISKHVDHVIFVPNTLPMISPILNIIPLQLFAYYVAVRRGLDVDKPRNLAKSSIVE